MVWSNLGMHLVLAPPLPLPRTVPHRAPLSCPRRLDLSRTKKDLWSPGRSCRRILRLDLRQIREALGSHHGGRMRYPLPCSVGPNAYSRNRDFALAAIFLEGEKRRLFSSLRHHEWQNAYIGSVYQMALCINCVTPCSPAPWAPSTSLITSRRVLWKFQVDGTQVSTRSVQGRKRCMWDNREMPTIEFSRACASASNGRKK